MRVDCQKLRNFECTLRTVITRLEYQKETVDKAIRKISVNSAVDSVIENMYKVRNDIEYQIQRLTVIRKAVEKTVFVYESGEDKIYNRIDGSRRAEKQLFSDFSAVSVDIGESWRFK